MNEKRSEVAKKLISAVIEGVGLIGLDESDFQGLFKVIDEFVAHRMPIGRIQFEETVIDENNNLSVWFALSPMILSSAKETYRGINTVKWFIVLPDLNMDFSELTVSQLLAKSELGLIETPNYDLDELAYFLDKERLPFFN